MPDTSDSPETLSNLLHETLGRFLVERKSLPSNDFQKIEAAYHTARERYQMAVEGTRLEDRHAAIAQALAAKAQASEESKRLGDTRLLAPITGNISMRRIDPGQTVASGAPPCWRTQSAIICPVDTDMPAHCTPRESMNRSPTRAALIAGNAS